MTNGNFSVVDKMFSRWGQRLLLGIGVIVVLAIVSCSSVQRSVVTVPAVPGAAGG